MDSRITRAFANRDYETQIAQTAERLARGDPLLQLDRDRASLESGVPFAPGRMGFADYASLLASIKAMEAAEAEAGMGLQDWAGLGIDAASTIGSALLLAPKSKAKNPLAAGAPTNG